jgi:site-specific DNA-methyltransferase (adenine-specific)
MNPSTDPFRIFPKATESQRAELKRSIDTVGLQNPVVVDEQKNVIDGHDRRDICSELGIDWLAGADVRIGLTDDQKKALAIDLNMWRKPLHLTRDKRNELIEVYLVVHPELSETQVAELFGVDQSTINRRKKRLMQTHKLRPVQATVGTDGVRRKVGNRGGARLTIKSEKEFDSIVPDIVEVGDDLQGIIRRPKRFSSTAKRKRNLAEVKEVAELPAQTSLHHCDWRELEIEDGSVDVILTDVLWELNHRSDWCALAERAKRWLKPSGVFATMIGSFSLPYLYQEVMKHLRPIATISVFLKQGRRNWKETKMIERWRPVPVFAFEPKEIHGDDVIFSDGAEKDFHDYQQNVGVFTELLKRLSKPGDLIVDPCMGTGTTGLACLSLGEGRQFVGGDRDPEMCRIARHRMVHDAASA